MISRLATEYLEGVHCDPTEVELSTLNGWINSEFKSLWFPVQFISAEISLDECKQLFKNSGVLFISSLHNNSKILTCEQNLKFRAIHDYSHILLGADSTFEGEWDVWFHNDAPDSIQWILHSEIVLQAAVTVHTGSFPVQKLVRF